MNTFTRYALIGLFVYACIWGFYKLIQAEGPVWTYRPAAIMGTTEEPK